MKFEINRETWIRGNPNQGTLLREEDGHQCCLGFFLEACGVSRDNLASLGEPHEPFQWQGSPDTKEIPIPPAASFLIHVEQYEEDEDGDPCDDRDLSCTDAGSRLMGWNDDGDLAEAAREKAIADEFWKHGHEAVFVGSSQATCEGQDTKP